MIGDLYVGILIFAMLLAAGIFAGFKAARRIQSFALSLIALAITVLIVTSKIWLSDSLLVTRVLPVSNVIILGNGIHFFGGLLAGVVAGLSKVPRWRRGVLVGLMVSVSFFVILRDVWGAPPAVSNRWKGEVCLQTTNATCGAASAATLLRAYGIASTEAEMAELCLSRPTGTYLLGLYRGLKLKADPLGMEVEGFSGWRLGELTNALSDGPVILVVVLEKDDNSDPRFARDWGWIPGVCHTVVCFGINGGKVDMGDPAVGREFWDLEGVRVLWKGQGFQLRRRR